MSFLAGMFGAAALGAAAATTQDLVLPRMRGTATAAFFLGTTLVGLSFGPYMVGQISDMAGTIRSEEHTSELQSLMRNSYAVFRLKKPNHQSRAVILTVHVLGEQTH